MKRQAEEEQRIKSEKSLFGKFKSMFRKPNIQPRESVVLEVVKSNSITIGKDGQFYAQALSPEWEEIIRRSGLKPADMNNKDIAKIVMEETIIYQTRKAAEADPSILHSAAFTSIQNLQVQE